MLCPSPLSDLVSLYTFIKFPPFHQNLHEFFIIVRYANLYIMICWFLLLAYHNCRRCLNMSGLHKETCWSSLASSSLANNSSGGFLNLFHPEGVRAWWVTAVDQLTAAAILDSSLLSSRLNQWTFSTSLKQERQAIASLFSFRDVKMNNHSTSSTWAVAWLYSHYVTVHNGRTTNNTTAHHVTNN